MKATIIEPEMRLIFIVQHQTDISILVELQILNFYKIHENNLKNLPFSFASIILQKGISSHLYISVVYDNFLILDLQDI